MDTDADYRFERVVESSGRYVFRAWFGDSSHPRDELANELVSMGALIEWSSPDLLAVDAADLRLAEELSGWLAVHERDGHVTYETGRS